MPLRASGRQSAFRIGSHAIPMRSILAPAVVNAVTNPLTHRKLCRRLFNSSDQSYVRAASRTIRQRPQLAEVGYVPENCFVPRPFRTKGRCRSGLSDVEGMGVMGLMSNSPLPTVHHRALTTASRQTWQSRCESQLHPWETAIHAPHLAILSRVPGQAAWHHHPLPSHIRPI